jgi:hypothetical protein
MHIIGSGSENDKYSIKLETMKRRRIPNEQRMQRPPEAMLAAKEMLLGNHPDWELRSLNSVYNCMGMVFASRRTCVEPDHFAMIVEDDGYVERTQNAEAKAGDVAVYKSTKDGTVIHVGTIMSIKPQFEMGEIDLMVLSQFGADGEYLHKADELPEALILLSREPEMKVWTEAKTYE